MKVEEDNNGYGFLIEEEDTKIVRLICNHLSLGQFELARALIQQVQQEHCGGNPHDVSSSPIIQKVSSILHQTIKNGPPSSWLTSESVTSSSHLQWLCSIELYNLNREGFKSNIKERTLLLIEFSLMIYTTLGELANSDRTIVPIIQELRDFHCVLINNNINNNNSSGQLLTNRLSSQCQALIKKVLLQSPEMGSFMVRHLSDPFTSIDGNGGNAMLMSQHPVSAQLELVLCDVVNQMISNGHFKEAYQVLSVIDLRDRDDSEDSVNRDTLGNESSTLTRCLQRVANLGVLPTVGGGGGSDGGVGIGIGIDDRSTLAKIPFQSVLDPMVADYEKTGAMSRMRIYESLLANRTLYPMRAFSAYEDEILRGAETQIDPTTGTLQFPQCFHVLKSYQQRKRELINDNSNSIGIGGNNNNNNNKLLDDFWYWYYHFLRVNNHHFLEYALDIAIRLVKEKRFQEAILVVKPFEKLLPLLILLCWDYFKDDIESRKSLTLLLDQDNLNNNNNNNNGFNNIEIIEGYDELLLHSNKQLNYLVEMAQWCCRNMIAVPNSPGGSRLVVGEKSFDVRDTTLSMDTSKTIEEVSNAVINQFTDHSLIHVIRHCLPFISSSDILTLMESDPDFPSNYRQHLSSPSVMSDQSNVALAKLNDMNLVRGYYLMKNILKFFQYSSDCQSIIDTVEFEMVLEDMVTLVKGISDATVAIGLVEAIYLSIFLSSHDIKQEHRSKSNNNNGNGGGQQQQSQGLNGTNSINFSLDEAISLSESVHLLSPATYESILSDPSPQMIGLLDCFDNSMAQTEQIKSDHNKTYYITSSMMTSLISSLMIVLEYISNTFNSKGTVQERIQILTSNLENLKHRISITNWIQSKIKNNNIPFMSLILMPVQSLLSMCMRTNYPQFDQAIKYFQVSNEIEVDVNQYQSIPILLDYLVKNPEGDINQDLTNQYKGIGKDDIFPILCDIVLGSHQQVDIINNGLIQHIIKIAKNQDEVSNNNQNNNGHQIQMMKRYIDWVLALHSEYTDRTLYQVIGGSSSTQAYPMDNRNGQLVKFIHRKRLVLESVNKLFDSTYNNNNNNNNNNNLDQQDNIILMESVKSIIENDIDINAAEHSINHRLLSSTFKYILSINSILKEVVGFDTTFQNGWDNSLSTLSYTDILSNFYKSPKKILEDIVFNQKNYEKAEKLSKYLQIDLADFIINHLNQSNQSNQQQQQSNNYLTKDLVNYFTKSSILLSTVACMLKSPNRLTTTTTSDESTTILQMAIEQSKQLPTSTLSNWITEMLRAVTLVKSDQVLESLATTDSHLATNCESIQQQQQFFFKIIQQLVANQQLLDALSVADEFIEDGAPDWLLKLLVGSDKQCSHVYIRRMRDRQRARQLVIELYHNWDVGVCIDMIVLCKSFDEIDNNNNLSPSSNNSNSSTSTMELTKLHQCLIIYQSILLEDKLKRWQSWQEIADLCRRDPATMVRQLLDSKHYELARKIRNLFAVSNIHNEIEERYLLYLLVEKDDASLALQTLSTLGTEAIGIVTSLLPKLREVSVKLFLVQFLLSNMRAELPEERREELKQQEMGYKVLLLLPSDLQKEYEPFVNYPNLILEMLVMNEKIPLVAKLINEIKDLKNDDLLTYYARKALSFNRYMAKNELLVVDDYLQKSNDLNVQQKNHHQQNNQQQKNQQQNNQQQQFGNQTPSTYSFEFGKSATVGHGSPGQMKEKIAAKGPKWVLSGKDMVEDEKIRHNHFYVRSPSISLAKSLFDLCESKKKVYQTSLELYNYLSSRLQSSTYSDDNLLIINMIQQLLLYTKLQLLRDPKTGGPTFVAVCDTYLGKVELFQSLVISKCSGTMSLTDLSDSQKARQLRDRLITEDRLRLAIDVATKCNIPADPAWVAWGFSLIQLGSYSDARDKFKYCMSSSGDRRVMSPSTSLSQDNVDSSVILNQIIQHLEAPPTPNYNNLRNLFNQLTLIPINAKGLSSRMDDQQFYNLLIPSISSGSGSGSSNSLSRSNDDNLRLSSSINKSGGLSKTIDNVRLDEAIYYIKKYGNGRMHANFLMKHGLMELACRTVLSDSFSTQVFFDEIVMHNVSHSTLPELFSTIKSIDPSLASYNDHLMASCRIMNERKWYSLLFEFQLYMNDHIRAGLTCIKMFIANIDSPSTTRIHHLEQAIQYFHLGINQRGVLSELDLNKYLQNTSTQIEVSRFLYSNQKLAPPGIHRLSVFGTSKQKAELVEHLTTMNNFELGFKLSQEFKLDLAPIYTNALSTMARRKNYSKIEEVLNNLRNFIDPTDWDQIAMAVIEVCAEMKELKLPEKFISKLHSAHNCIRVCILCNKLKTAYLKAVQLQDRHLLTMVMDEAQRTNQPVIFKYCQDVLSGNQPKN